MFPFTTPPRSIRRIADSVLFPSPPSGTSGSYSEAQGGQLQAAIISLQAMVKSTEDKNVKKRYQEEVGMFMQAVQVQKAVSDFHAARQRYPTSLDELVPEFIPALPSFGSAFELTWTPPVVGLSRPGIPKSKPATLAPQPYPPLYCISATIPPSYTPSLLNHTAK